MRRKLLLASCVLILALVPATGLAQDAAAEDDLLIRINGPIEVQPDETLDSVVVFSDQATVNGTVRDALIVINGDAVVSGQVQGDVTVINGTLRLQPGATVNDVNLFGSDIAQDPGATVTGTIQRQERIDTGWSWFAFSVYWWLGTTAVLLVAGLLFAAIGGRQLSEAGALVTRRPGPTALAALVVAVGLPLLAIVAFVTVVGIPLGIAIVLFLAPALAFLGYLVAGTELGAVILRATSGRTNPGHPYLAALIGLLILQVVGLVPVLGALVGFVAAFMGTGALAYLAWRAWRTPSAPVGEPVRAPTPEPTA